MDAQEHVDRWRTLPDEKRHRLWFRCSEPERPTDPNTVWHYEGCAACQFGVRQLLADGDNGGWHQERVVALADRMGVEP